MVGSADGTVQNSFQQTWQQLWEIIYKYYVLKQIDYNHAKHTPMVTGRFDATSFHIQVVSIRFRSFKVYQQQQQLQFIQLSDNLSLCMYR